MQIYETHTGIVSSVAFSPDGQWLVSGDYQGVLCFYADGDVAKTIQLQEPPILDLHFNPEGNRLAITQRQEVVFFEWKNSWKLCLGLRFGGQPISHARFLNDTYCLIALGDPSKTVTAASTIMRFDITNKQTQRFNFDVTHGIAAMAVDGERKMTAWLTDDRWLHLQDLTRPKAKPVARPGSVRSMALSPDGRYLALGAEWEVQLFPVNGFPQRSRLFPRVQGQINALVFLPDSQTLVSGSNDQTVRYWDVEREVEILSYQWPIGRVQSLAVAPDGLRLVAGGDIGRICVWDLDR